MKFLVLALFVAIATAAPIEDDGGPVEVIVNGVPEGQPIDLSDIVNIKLQEHVNGEVAAATNLLHPFTAVGIAEAEAAAAAAAAADTPVIEAPVVPQPVFLPEPIAPEVVVPEPVILPAPVAPVVSIPESVVLPQPVALPAPVAPEVSVSESVVIPQPVVLPAPVAPEVSIPESVVLPMPVAPEVVMPVIPEPVGLPSPVAPEVVVPAPASVPTGEIFNDGTVSVTVNAPEEAGYFSAIQSWFSMVLNYFNNGVQTSQQIV